jgi:hypothetical protein
LVIGLTHEPGAGAAYGLQEQRTGRIFKSLYGDFLIAFKNFPSDAYRKRNDMQCLDILLWDISIESARVMPEIQCYLWCRSRWFNGSTFCKYQRLQKLWWLTIKTD